MIYILLTVVVWSRVYDLSKVKSTLRTLKNVVKKKIVHRYGTLPRLRRLQK